MKRAFSTDKIKRFGEDRFTNERVYTRQAGIGACKEKNMAVEVYGGAGTLNKMYKEAFKLVVGNDSNPSAPTQYHLLDKDFVPTILPKLGRVDLIDFDCYGNRNNLIDLAIQILPKPFVLCVSDGLGLSLKLSKKIDLNKFYRCDVNVEQWVDVRHPWRQQDALMRHFLKQSTSAINCNYEVIAEVRSKNKNFVFGSYYISQG